MFHRLPNNNETTEISTTIELEQSPDGTTVDLTVVTTTTTNIDMNGNNNNEEEEEGEAGTNFQGNLNFDDRST